MNRRTFLGAAGTIIAVNRDPDAPIVEFADVVVVAASGTSGAGKAAKPLNILILGGTGYAGGHLAQEAAGRGHDVLALSRTAPEQVPAGVTHRAGDVREDRAE